MDNLHDSYKDEKETDRFSFSTQHGAVTVVVSEAWVELDPIVVSCGNSTTQGVQITSGISKEDFREFTAEITVNFGFQSIVHLETKMSEKKQITLTTKREETRTITYTVTAEKCETKTCFLEQKINIYDFTFQPWLTRSNPYARAVSRRLIERTNQYNDIRKKNEWNPGCNCREKPTTQGSQIFIKGAFGNVQVNYYITKSKDDTIRIWNTDIAADGNMNADNGILAVRIEEANIPEYIKELSGLHSEALYLHIFEISAEDDPIFISAYPIVVLPTYDIKIIDEEQTRQEEDLEESF